MKPSCPSLLLFSALYDEHLVVQPSSKSEWEGKPMLAIETEEFDLDVNYFTVNRGIGIARVSG